MRLEQYQLPDGRLPIRFDTGNAAFYPRYRGEGEVRYTFSRIRYRQGKGGVMTKEELSDLGKRRAAAILKKDPSFFKRNGSKGGKMSKRGLRPDHH